MTVTEITEINKTKSKIYIDHEFAFVLYKGEIHKNNIRQGEEISSEIYDFLTGEVLPKRAKLRAMHLLTKRPYTERKLRQKLQEGMYSEACIDCAIAYVKSYGYIDDMQYACDFINYHSSTLSRKQIETKLLQKGITQEVIRQAYERECPGGQEEQELGQIMKLFHKKYGGRMPEEPGERMKMMQFYMRKGYSQNMVKKALKIVNEDSVLDEIYN